MRNIYRLSIVLALGLLISSFAMFSFWQLNAEIVYAQDDQIENGYDVPVYDDPASADNFDSTQPQNPDPEFMEEVEPGEYNQSDNVTEINNNGY